ncbi:MAG: carboxypeptidase-like regulatory domain-containing protein [Bacteroidia bacterium]
MHAQTLVLKGRVESSVDQSPLAFAGILTNRSMQGTISSETGFFRIQYAENDDSLVVRLLGYHEKRLPVLGSDSFLVIQLEPQIMQLGEVVISAKEEEYLYRLLLSVNRAASKTESESRAYFELKSYLNNQQVELVESFYNILWQGPDVYDLRLKAGRLALRPFQQRLFANIDGSKSVARMFTFRSNGYFPASPFDYKPNALRKRYLLYSEGGFRNDNGDSVLVIRFVPRSAPTKRFAGRAWLNLENNELLELNLVCKQAAVYPFLPMFTDDVISSVDLDITRSFSYEGGEMRTKRINFSYQLAYLNRHKQLYTAKTEAVLLAYAPGEPFELPSFTSSSSDMNDYLRINAFPYNPVFWQSASETRIHDQFGENEAFFNHPSSRTNMELFKRKSLIGNALLETPFVHWDGQRVIFTQRSERPEPIQAGKREVRVDDYHLQVHVFLDLNTIGDSLHWQTATIFDPYQSYFYLPMTNGARCFINMYFDLMEMERRRLEQLFTDTKPDMVAAKQLFIRFKAELDSISEQFFKDVMIGNNRKGMYDWNERIYEALKIDNISLFDPFEEAK